jgi:hypothetical protein
LTLSLLSKEIRRMSAEDNLTQKRRIDTMGVAINVKSLEEVPEIMREFVTEADGGFDYDFDKAFKALKEEREGRRADRIGDPPLSAY